MDYLVMLPAAWTIMYNIDRIAELERMWKEPFTA
jgi:hypothetical protein